MERRQVPPLLPPPNWTRPNGKLEQRKRRLYLIASLVAFPSIYYVWQSYGDTQPFIHYVYPFFMAAALLWIVGLIWRRIPLIWTERFVLITIALLLLVRFVYYFYVENPARAWKEIESIAGAIVILIIISYLVLSHQLAIRLTLIYVALTVVLGVARLSGSQRELLPDFIRLETRLIVTALLTFILAKVKDDLLVAQQEADYWERQANVDHLTQLPNRRMISSLIEQYIHAKKPFAILLIDVDDFKCFNDTYGHDVGDLLLRRIAYALKTNLRATDFAARWGGEEFLVLASETNASHASELAERLRSEVQKVELDENLISISIGGTLFTPQDDLESLLKRADNALYQAKNQGRNCVCWEYG